MDAKGFWNIAFVSDSDVIVIQMASQKGARMQKPFIKDVQSL